MGRPHSSKIKIIKSRKFEPKEEKKKREEEEKKEKKE
jgi:hypothetical protein